MRVRLPRASWVTSTVIFRFGNVAGVVVLFEFRQILSEMDFGSLL